MGTHVSMNVIVVYRFRYNQKDTFDCHYNTLEFMNRHMSIPLGMTETMDTHTNAGTVMSDWNRHMSILLAMTEIMDTHTNAGADMSDYIIMKIQIDNSKSRSISMLININTTVSRDTPE